jgi:hypothetical protein
MTVPTHPKYLSPVVVYTIQSPTRLLRKEADVDPLMRL